MSTIFYEDLLRYLDDSNSSYITPASQLKEAASYYKKVDGKLVFLRNDAEIPVLTTRTEQVNAIKSFHGAKNDEHMGKCETYSRLKKNYHWRGIRMDVENYVYNCATCTKVKPVKDEYPSRCQFSSQIWKEVHVEIFGPLPKGWSGESYAMVAYDFFSRWIEAKAISDKNAVTIADFLVECCARHSMATCVFNNVSENLLSEIREIVKTRWENFVESRQEFETVLNEWKCVNTTDPENFLKSRETLLENLKDWILKCDESWVTRLLPKVYSLRISVNDEDGMSPFQIVYGRSPAVVSDMRAEKLDAVPVKMYHVCKFCGLVFRTQRALETHVRWHAHKANKAEKPSGDANPIENGTKSTYGLRTTLKPSGKSAIVKRMMHRSRRKRSADKGPQEVDGEEGSAVSSTKMLKMADECMVVEVEPCGQEDTVLADVEEEEELQVQPKQTKLKRGRPPKKKNIVSLDEGPKKLDGSENQPQECKVCVAKFTANAKDMELHNAYHKEDSKLFHCPQCKTVTGLWARMQEHLEKEHRSLLPTMDDKLSEIGAADDITLEDNNEHFVPLCLVCPRINLGSSAELDLHVECHRSESRLLHCPHCGLVGTRWSNMKRHLAVEHNRIAEGPGVTDNGGVDTADLAEINVFNCGVCNLIIKGDVDLRRHMQIHEDTVYECEDCEFASRAWTVFVDHRASHKFIGYNCPICKKHFGKKERLKAHMEVHQENRVSAVCDKCGLTLMGGIALKRHIKNMHGDGSVQYPCPLCPYVGKTRIYLRKHVAQLHNKPLSCDLCKYGCHSEIALAKHKDIFHNEEGRKFPCTECAYRGRDAKQLSEHVRFHHNPKSPRFMCDVCGTGFRSHTMLRDHLPIHSKQCDYECQMCGYKTRYRRTMYRHAQNKHKDSPASMVFKGTSVSEKPAGKKTSKRKPRVKKVAASKNPHEAQEENVLLPTNIVVKMGDTDGENNAVDFGERNVVLTTCDGQLLRLEGLSGEHSIVLDAALLGHGNGTITLRENVHFQIVRTSNEDIDELDTDPDKSTGIFLAIEPEDRETETVMLVAASEEDTGLAAEEGDQDKGS